MPGRPATSRPVSRTVANTWLLHSGRQQRVALSLLPQLVQGDTQGHATETDFKHIPRSLSWVAGSNPSIMVRRSTMRLSKAQTGFIGGRDFQQGVHLLVLLNSRRIRNTGLNGKISA